jgi:putative intracellular protease/amidase
VFLVKAFAAQDDHTASVCGVIALAAFLGAVALARLIVRTAVSR